MSFAGLVKKRREALGFSQARLGELVGRSATTIRNWERGLTTPSERPDALALAAVLGLDEDEVLEQAGFDRTQRREAESRPTMDQEFASLLPAPVRPEPEDDEETSETGSSRHEAPSALTSVPQSLPTVDPVIVPETDTGPRHTRVEREPVLAGLMEAVMERRRRLARAAPPTVLERAPTGEPSYLEDPDERQRYRTRAIVTAAVVVALFVVLLWSFDRATESMGRMWDEFFRLLEI